MKISVVLLDWSVRESFHAIRYLNNQTSQRSDYELIWVEYFKRKVPELEEFHHTGLIDKYLIMGNEAGNYNKHEAWNFGVMKSSGDIVILCDSDAMFMSSFIKNVIGFFNGHDNSFLYIDEIRSNNKCFWPFNYPSWEEVMSAPGLINWNEQLHVTSGLTPNNCNLPLSERLYIRNYGACLCVKKADYIRYGGLDEHESYIGYMCGPYDLAIRMANAGMQENWHPDEFLLHTYHPGGKSAVDRMGPHIRSNSIMSFKHLYDGNIMPYVENKPIRILRKQLFQEPHRIGDLKFSVIVLDSQCRYIQRLYDSVGRSTKQPYEVIFIGDEEFMSDEDGLKYIRSSAPLHEAIEEGCHNAVGEIIIIVPYQAIFRRNTLDGLLDSDGRLMDSAVFLKTMVTYTEGFTWQYDSDNFTHCGILEKPIAFERGLLPEILDELENNTFKPAKASSVDLHASAQMEIWEENACEDDNELNSILNRMEALKHKVIAEKTYEAKLILEQINAVEKDNPGKFFKYFFIRKYSYQEYFEFLNIFINSNWTGITVNGLRLFTDNAALLLEDINEGISEVKWLHNLLYREIAGSIENAYLHLAIYTLDKSDTQNAVAYLKSRLEINPNNRFCRKLLQVIGGN